MAFGGTVKLTGESEYKKALADITGNLKVLNSEMKIVTSQYDKNDKSSSNLTQQNEVLNKKITEQKEKVNILTKALSDADQETGKNSSTSQKWRIELNNAQAELNKLVKKVEDNEKAMKDSADATEKNADAIDELGEEAEESGKSVLKLGDLIKANLISDAIKGGLSALASGMKQVGSALVGVGKQAIDSYAQYEQLVGGVDTLFKESSSKVQAYADVAYKTAGLSANQYMETVTSFSASLLQSLNGDTAKSAEIANMAIIDMSDNANKMGTSMDMIQNAYQGFAKQNWTMLDNLKLGYGGTAREMARLVNESGVLGDKLIDLDDKQNLNANLQEVGYAKIIEAVHKVQQEMGITGTTSLEASETISGSVSSMKSAWQNLLTGIADDNADFDELVDNFVESLVGKNGEGGALSNLLPRIETALNGVVKLVVSLSKDLLPQIMPIAVDLIKNLVTSISENLPALLDSANMILGTLIDGIISLLPDLLDIGIKMIVSLVQGIADGLPEFMPVIIDTIGLIVGALMDNLDLIISVGIELIIALAKGIITALPLLIEKIPVIIEKLVLSLADLLSPVIEWCGSAFAEVGKFFEDIGTSIGEFFTNAWTSVTDFFTDIFTSIGEFFTNMFTSIGEFFTNAWDSIQKFLDNPIYYIGYAIGTISRIVVDFFTVTIPKWWNNMLESVTNFFTKLGESIKTFFTKTIPDTWDKFKKNIAEFGKKLIASIKEFFTVKIPNAWDSLKTKLKNLIDDVVGKIKTFFTETIPNAWASFKKKVSKAVSGFGDFFKDLPTKLKNIGKDIVDGLWNGIKGKWQDLKDKAKNLANELTRGFKDAFGIHSPSLVFKEQVGKNLALGVGEGFADTMAGVSADMQGAIPTEFDTSVHTNYSSGASSNYDMMVMAFKQALAEVKVVMNNREMGAFVTETVGREVFA